MEFRSISEFYMKFVLILMVFAVMILHQLISERKSKALNPSPFAHLVRHLLRHLIVYPTVTRDHEPSMKLKQHTRVRTWIDANDRTSRFFDKRLSMICISFEMRDNDRPTGFVQKKPIGKRKKFDKNEAWMKIAPLRQAKFDTKSAAAPAKAEICNWWNSIYFSIDCMCRSLHG